MSLKVVSKLPWACLNFGGYANFVCKDTKRFDKEDVAANIVPIDPKVLFYRK